MHINLGLLNLDEAQSSWIILIIAMVVGPLARALPLNNALKIKRI